MILVLMPISFLAQCLLSKKYIRIYRDALTCARENAVLQKESVIPLTLSAD